MRTVLAAALFALGLACAAGLARPGPADEAWAAQRWPGTTLADLELGRALYVRRCSGCHNLYLPRQYPPEQWGALVEKMVREKVALTETERESVTRFLVTLSAQPPEVK